MKNYKLCLDSTLPHDLLPWSGFLSVHYRPVVCTLAEACSARACCNFLFCHFLLSRFLKVPKDVGNLFWRSDFSRCGSNYIFLKIQRCCWKWHAHVRLSPPSLERGTEIIMASISPPSFPNNGMLLMTSRYSVRCSTLCKLGWALCHRVAKFRDILMRLSFFCYQSQCQLSTWSGICYGHTPQDSWTCCSEEVISLMEMSPWKVYCPKTLQNQQSTLLQLSQSPHFRRIAYRSQKKVTKTNNSGIISKQCLWVGVGLRSHVLSSPNHFAF